MDKIHFCSLFGIDLDIDLAPFWTEHYLKFGFNDYFVFLHSGKHDRIATLEAKAFFEERGFGTEIVSQDYSFANGNLRQLKISEYRNSFPANDFLVVADSDEFQEIHYGYREMVLESDAITGQLLDRWDNTLHNAIIGVPLKRQFPFSGTIYQAFSKSGVLAEHAGTRVMRDKIIAARCSLPINFIGSHGLDESVPDIRLRTGYDVLHYTYRANYIARMRTKSYYNKEQYDAVEKFFGVRKGGKNA